PRPRDPPTACLRAISARSAGRSIPLDSIPVRRGLLHGAVLTVAVAVACQGRGYFVCGDDRDCATAEGGGVCQPEGACSFHDDTCPSGQRFGAAGEPALAGQCVGGDASSTGQVEDPSTTDPGGATSTADATAATSDSTGDGCPDGWWDCAWAHRQRLELARPLDATLTDVPVLRSEERRVGQ